MIITINLLHKHILYILYNSHQKERKNSIYISVHLSQNYTTLHAQCPHLIRREIINLPAKNYVHSKKCEVPNHPHGLTHSKIYVEIIE